MVIVFSGALLKFVNYQREHQVDAATPRGGIDTLTNRFPDLKKALLDEAGDFRKFNLIYIDKAKASPTSLCAEAGPATRVEIITAIAGG